MIGHRCWDSPKRAQQGLGAGGTWTLGRLLRDPLLHFLALGGLLFLAGLAWQRTHDARRIIVDTFARERPAVEYRQRFGASPSPQAFRGVIDDYVAEEVLYQEGLARGIDRGDEIIRRRVIQKMRFLEENRSVNPVPDDTVLRAYFDRHQRHYATAAGVTFSHIYFSADTGNPRIRAEKARASLDDGGRSEGRVRQCSLIAFVKLMASATRLMVLFEVRTDPPQHGVGWVEPANVVYAVADRGRARAC
ncbi:hypothetical protein [Novosphingobium sp. BL-52-GroH]|uniref:hypothetical protein n=1 Tax=Novosphingobium sp. BL-52-GroH TaxID=3349877 RepID=UPI00384B8E28